MPVVERRNVRLAEPLGHRDYGRVDSAEREICVLLDELRHPLEICSGRRLESELATSSGAQ